MTTGAGKFDMDAAIKAVNNNVMASYDARVLRALLPTNPVMYMHSSKDYDCVVMVQGLPFLMPEQAVMEMLGTFDGFFLGLRRLTVEFSFAFLILLVFHGGSNRELGVDGLYHDWDI